MHIKQANTQQT